MIDSAEWPDRFIDRNPEIQADLILSGALFLAAALLSASQHPSRKRKGSFPGGKLPANQG